MNGLSELVLVVRDVNISAAFYRDVVGLEVEQEPGKGWAWFRTNGRSAYPSRLAVSEGPLLYEEHSPRPEGARWGPVHFALGVDRDEVRIVVQRVSRAGITIHGPRRFEWMRAESYYFYDPDANLVELWSLDPPAGPVSPRAEGDHARAATASNG